MTLLRHCDAPASLVTCDFQTKIDKHIFAQMCLNISAGLVNQSHTVITMSMLPPSFPFGPRLTPRCSFAPRWAFMSSSLCESRAVLAAQSSRGLNAGHTWTPTDADTTDQVWTEFDPSDVFACVSVSFVYSARKHLHNLETNCTFLTEGGSHTRL